MVKAYQLSQMRKYEVHQDKIPVRTLNKSSTVTGTLAWKTVKNFQTD
jgi:hypothetical protein